MSPKADQLLEAALQLPEPERARLAAELTASVRRPVEPRRTSGSVVEDPADRALTAIRSALPPGGRGKWLVVADGGLVATVDTFEAALEEGERRFPDGRALIAPADERDELWVPAAADGVR